MICLVIFGVVMFGIFMLAEKWFAKQPILPLGIFGSTTNFASLLGLMMQSMVTCAPRGPHMLQTDNSRLVCWRSIICLFFSKVCGTHRP